MSADATFAETKQVTLTRDVLCSHCSLESFEKLIKGAMVRYSMGYSKTGEALYRLYEIIGVGENTPEAYRVNGQKIDRTLQMKHGDKARSFRLDNVSNSSPTKAEFQALTEARKQGGVKMPTKRELREKAEQLKEWHIEIAEPAQLFKQASPILPAAPPAKTSTKPNDPRTRTVVKKKKIIMAPFSASRKQPR
ncbi:hypothetical protein SISNIDRAFT_470050 [Sistotremastrum niveocremeum HHB9708]|uniref:Plus3 domain-containing protein n=1 Tax=Sistotremastrum niveocremeum HHB9708 TaxID=1314777 RepID=A0A164PCX5_9AGAM|nr:hypothetical protein SISNIDRAFT_470050 [Sistotremastrum niveocremeum HHB9708]